MNQIITEISRTSPMKSGRRLRKGREGSCYRSAARWALADFSLTYWEGWVRLAEIGQDGLMYQWVIPHAWVTDADGIYRETVALGKARAIEAWGKSIHWSDLITLVATNKRFGSFLPLELPDDLGEAPGWWNAR
jgi:hypothetical protein